ncbi:hypothetical protein ILYODFUR_026999 [Ilyodon furcidens]|uniref:B30.2/SPRY domain-containing protein n=1 Tax=Ilyodon furcidens TaxID=33524 RepID=A0ABV0UJD6_9TELE
MDQCEDREEGVPPSETTLCGEHESKAKRFKSGLKAKLTDICAKSERSKKDHTGFKFNVPTYKARKPAGVQQLKDLSKYSCQLTIDTNTVSRNLKLSEDNRKVTWGEELQSYPDHPDRFDFPQLLCSDGLTGRCYWEVEWRGIVYISVSYRRIRRKGYSDDCWFGWNDQSWSLSCSDGGYSVWHNKSSSSSSSSFSSSSSSVSNRVAVYVDCPAGILSFYRVSSDSLIHLHTINTTFTEPLYPGFWIGSGSSVFLCSLPRSEPLATSELSPSSNVGGTPEASKDQTRDTEAETSETSELKEVRDK